MLRKLYYFPKYSLFVFFALVLILFYFYDFQSILFLHPQGVHQWRQCDCLSMTLNFYHGNVDFFTPQVHNLGIDGTGKTVSDFPLLYYGIAQLWHITGHHELVYRIVVLLFALTGVSALFKAVEMVLKDTWLAIFVALILWSSTIFTYYANNFLMNVPAFSLALVGLYFFTRFYLSGKNRFYNLSFLFFFAGGLLKTPALMSFAAIFVLFLLEQVSNVKLGKEGKLFNNPRRQIIPFILVFIVIGIWYTYASWYNHEHDSGFFLVGILPIWDISWDHIKKIVDFAHVLWFNSYQSVLMQEISIAVFVFVLSQYKKVNRFLWFFMVTLFLGFVSFILLFFQVFDNHDYYMINQLIFMLSIFTAFFHLLKSRYPKIFYNLVFRILLLVLLVYNVKVCAHNIADRYNSGSWMNDHAEQTNTLAEMSPYLSSIGVKQDDKVLVLGDRSINISLYLIDRRGYTNFGLGKVISDDKMKQLEKSGVHYMIVLDTTELHETWLQPYVQDKIGQFKKIAVYKLNE